MGENKIKKMSLRLFYYLLFYKLYKFTSFKRSKEGAVVATSLSLGFLFIFWMLNILAAFDINYNVIPNYIFIIIFCISIGTNILYTMKKRKYEIMISEIESTKIPFAFHGLAYLLYLWTFVGILFL